MTSAKAMTGIVILGLAACGCLGKVSEPPSADQGSGGSGGVVEGRGMPETPEVDGGPQGAPQVDPDPGQPGPADDGGPVAIDAGPQTSVDASDPGDGGCISDSGTRCNRAPGEACMSNGECASGACFAGDDGTTFCSVECTADTATAVCTFGSHTCNQRGFCND
jgi:hypothetical protein